MAHQNKIIFLVCLTSAIQSHAMTGCQLVYAHGFGQEGDAGKLSFLDAPGNIGRTCFYGQEAVDTIKKYCEANVEGRCVLAGFSTGAGTTINFLSQETKNPNSKIMNKIKGIIIDSPMLDIRRSVAIKAIATGISVAAAGLVTLLGYQLFNRKFFKNNIDCGLTENIEKLPSITKKVIGALAGGAICLGSYALARPLAINSIVNYGLTVLTNWHFDPTYPTPYENLDVIKGKINVPVLLHFCKKDGILAHEKEDIVRTYESFRKNNEQNCFIVLSEPEEGSHNAPSEKWRDLNHAFYNRISNNEALDNFAPYALSIEDLKKAL